MKWLQEFWKWVQTQDKDKPRSTGTSTPVGPSSQAVPPATDRHAGIRPRAEAVHIQVGVDFGTSATKIAYQEGGRPGITPLVFDHGLAAVPSYCIPSVIAYDGDELVIGVEAARVRTVSRRMRHLG